MRPQHSKTSAVTHKKDRILKNGRTYYMVKKYIKSTINMALKKKKITSSLLIKNQEARGNGMTHSQC